MTTGAPQIAGTQLREQSYAEQRAHVASRLRQLLDERGFDWSRTRRIADIGCGKGHWLRTFLEWGIQRKQAFGIDLDEERLRAAQSRAPGTNAVHTDCRALPFADESFDLVTQFTLFTSLLEPESRARTAKEMLRIIRPGGLIVWYDFFAPNPLNPRTRPVGRTELAELFPGCSIRAERITFAAPLARMIARVSPRVAAAANQSDYLTTHYLALIEPCGRGAA